MNPRRRLRLRTQRSAKKASVTLLTKARIGSSMPLPRFSVAQAQLLIQTVTNPREIVRQYQSTVSFEDASLPERLEAFRVSDLRVGRMQTMVQNMDVIVRRNPRLGFALLRSFATLDSSPKVWSREVRAEERAS